MLLSLILRQPSFARLTCLDSGMQRPKLWQICVLALGIGAVGLLAYQIAALDDGLDLEHRSILVDVVGGEVFDVDTSRRGLGLPAAHPTNGSHTLVRIEKQDDGKWYVLMRDRPLVSDIKDIKAVSTDTWEVLVPVPDSGIPAYKRPQKR
jgi:hypothetical protein